MWAGRRCSPHGLKPLFKLHVSARLKSCPFTHVPSVGGRVTHPVTSWQGWGTHSVFSSDFSEITGGQRLSYCL